MIRWVCVFILTYSPVVMSFEWHWFTASGRPFYTEEQCRLWGDIERPKKYDLPGVIFVRVECIPDTLQFEEGMTI